MTERPVTLAIGGMHCAACAQTIEKALRRVTGVAEANVNFAAETARVIFDPSQTGIKRLIAVVQDTGYTAEPAGEQPQDEQEQARAAEIRRQGRGQCSVIYPQRLVRVPGQALCTVRYEHTGSDCSGLAVLSQFLSGAEAR